MNPQMLKTWSQRTAAVYTEDQGSFGMIVRELLRNFGWKVAVRTNDFAELVGSIKLGKADTLIIDDSAKTPSSIIVRRITADPICCLIPTLALSSDLNYIERKAMSKLGRPKIVEKPVTPDRFMPAFRELIIRWSSGVYVPIRKSAELLIRGQDDTAIEIMQKILQYESAHPFVLPSLAHYVALKESPKAAESLLLKALQGKSRDLSIVYALIDLYLKYSMPSLATRLLRTVYKSHANASCMIPDLALTSFMMNNLEDGVTYLKVLRKLNPEKKEITRYLCRTLFAEGKRDEFTRIASSGITWEKYEQEWGIRKAVLDELDAAG